MPKRIKGAHLTERPPPSPISRQPSLQCVCLAEVTTAGILPHRARIFFRHEIVIDPGPAGFRGPAALLPDLDESTVDQISDEILDPALQQQRFFNDMLEFR